MAKHLSEVEVKLENPVEIAKTGHQEEASLVLMRAPSMNCMKQASKIRNLCSMAEMAILKEAHAQQQD
ncbi:hypothetical protein GWN75_05960, partial [candidate division KSB1 bacterium]|nr:hypothetical protein [candidate division KSB1 bacterium]NIU24087.1 hypothetical protein [candidate division KSB1 bacterium]NIU92942.1 hypothetical protein [candidate division KSB1 bacterium]NIW17929.1 hypothetical protein [candidate division KSB1 bacterium]NIW68444.1 hypothetical protein [candidate division KSB1 bacterium]